MIFEYQDYRSYLKAVFEERARVSEGYSRRAFADKAGLSHSFLSEVLSGKKALSMELAYKIAVNLDLVDSETTYFCLLVQISNEKDPSFREHLIRRLRAVDPRSGPQELGADVFAALSDWHHAAILELTYLPSFQPEPSYIAARLGISSATAEVALNRLLRLEMLKKDEQGRVVKRDDPVIPRSDLPSAAFRRFHRQFLDKASESLDARTPAERVCATDVLPMDKRSLSEVARLVDEFATAVTNLSKRSSVRDGVYALSAHFFPLTEP